MRKFKFFFILVSMALLFSGCEEKLPVIFTIDPRIGIMGEPITIYGENFGRDQNESYITIAGASPTGSSYIRWQDDEIILRVPEFAEPGLIYVHREGKKSNPVLFANRAVMPEMAPDNELDKSPQINAIEPKSAAVGAIIAIQGSNFGSSRDKGGVWFSWEAESSLSAPADHRSSEGVEVFDTEFGYEFWSEREIRVRVPDGAVSGNLEVRTAKGNSRPVYFEITGKPGTKTFKEKRSYTLSYAVDIQVEEAALPNALYLWLPKPASSASQRNVQLLSRNTEPYVENYRGTSLYQFIDLQPKTGKHIALSYVMDAYTVETEVRSQAIRQEMESPIQTVYTLASALIPSDHPDIIAQSTAITGRERNPYLKAKLIYDWMIKEAGIREGFMGGGALEALEEKQADSYRSSLLFCSLARAAGIPCVPVSGVLVNRHLSTTRHYWAEFWVDAFGWIPVDPALGVGAAPVDFNLRDNPGAYYFGNADNQRIAFSRGQIILAQMDPQGRVAARTRDFAMQNLWEEAIGKLESYSSLWSDVTITGMYAQ